MRMIVFAFAACAAAVPARAAASQFNCSGQAVSPYPARVATDHDHGRVAPAHGQLWKPFSAYLAAFDEVDDDTGDGQPDLRINPDFVVYELRGVAPDTNGE